VIESTDVFERVEKFPNPAAGERYDRLVGLDDTKARLLKEARLLLNPDLLETWSKKHHGGAVLPVVQAFRERTPLFVFAGDVGTGPEQALGQAQPAQTAARHCPPERLHAVQ